MVLRAKYRHVPFTDWPAELARREPRAIAAARNEMAAAIAEFRFGQFLLLRQWRVIQDYAAQRGICLLGDLPIFVSPDSSDVWANPDLFLLDRHMKPLMVAGVPPDYFSADGQLWGNPLYDWNAHKQTKYRWWIRRLQARLDYLDAIRIDHFRGFEAAWHVPAGEPTAASGQWLPGPGDDFFINLRQALGRLPLLAEDLGFITPAVTALRNQFELPGMRVLQFAFNGDPNNPHLPHHCPHNCVIYTGTHDNDTTKGWYDTAPQQERDNFWKYAQRVPGHSEEAVWEMIRIGQSSDAALAIVPFQDVLGLGSEHRMNIPGRATGQWRWRCSEAAFDHPGWQMLRDLTKAANRSLKQVTSG
jgi:4-alpha-glucanotransferase